MQNGPDRTDTIVERGKLGDSLIVEAAADKSQEHQPVEQQCLRFASAGLAIAPQTLGRAVSAHIDLLMSVADAIATMTRAPGYLGTNATGIPVLDPSASGGEGFVSAAKTGSSPDATSAASAPRQFSASSPPGATENKMVITRRSHLACMR